MVQTILMFCIYAFHLVLLQTIRFSSFTSDHTPQINLMTQIQHTDRGKGHMGQTPWQPGQFPQM